MSKLSENELREIINTSYPDADLAEPADVDPVVPAHAVVSLDRAKLASKLAAMRGLDDADADDLPELVDEDSELAEIVLEDGTHLTTVVSANEGGVVAEQG